jgi:hypothetical protein
MIVVCSIIIIRNNESKQTANFEIRIQKLEDEMPIKADKQDLLDMENKIIDKLR